MSYRSIYDPPANYGIPNPLGPRTHNWRGGPLNEGSLYHGPVYTRPDYLLPWMPRPLNGELDTDPAPENASGNLSVVLPLVAVGGLIVILMWPRS